MDQEIVLATANRVATITLNRPDKRNAFTMTMIDAWLAALQACQADEAVHAIVVTGAGRAFCAGGDIGEMQEHASGTPLDRKNELWRRIHRIALTLEDIDKPVIAAVNGAATGAGMDMALMADIRFAGASATFAETYVKVGLVPGDGGAYFLPRLVGVAKALELIWSGDFIDAREAERLGIVNRVLPDGELLPSTLAFAERLANGPTLALRMAKRAVYQSLNVDLRTSLDLVSSHYGIVTQSHDHGEAVAAFLDKREPRFEGR